MRMRVKLAGAVAVLSASAVAAVAVAGPGDDFSANGNGYFEVPAVSSDGRVTWRAQLDEANRKVTYTLEYKKLEAPVQQAHLHFAQRDVNGGIAVFFCSDLGNGPPGTPACDDAPATINGEFGPSDVVGPAGQGIAPGEFDELVRAMRAGRTYVNVHTTMFPGGEVRGQVRPTPDDGGAG